MERCLPTIVKNKAVIIGAVDWCSTITAAAAGKLGAGSVHARWHLEDGRRILRLGPRALDGRTACKIRWSYKADGPVVAGITPSEGGVVFTGDMAGNFLVLDSASRPAPVQGPDRRGRGRRHHHLRARGGKQYVAATSGNVSRLTFGASGSPTLIIYTLGGQCRASRWPRRSAASSGSMRHDGRGRQALQPPTARPVMVPRRRRRCRAEASGC